MVVGEAPGEQEILKGEPFVGSSGMELSRMLHEAGLNRSECFLTNVVRERPPGNDISKFIAERKKDITPAHVPVRDRMCLPPVREGFDMLRKEIALVKPEVIIACGGTSLWALTGRSGITSWRGSILELDRAMLPDGWVGPVPIVIPTYHPAAILRQWSWRAVGVLDLRRAKKCLDKGVGQSPPPPTRFIVRPQFDIAYGIVSDISSRLADGPLKLAVDIETRGGHIACIGIAWSKADALCIPLMCVERQQGYWLEEEETALMHALYQLLTHPNCHVIGQNFLYDAQYFYRHLHYIPNVKRDTMLAQHCCFPNMPKGLDFLSSMYAEHHIYWKDEGKDWDAGMGEDQLWTYNCKDAVITFEVDDELQQTVDQIGLREQHDFQQSMFWPVLRAMIRGVRINDKMKGQIAMDLQHEIAVREQWFKDVLGHPLNPRSNTQMKALFYQDLRQAPYINRKTGAITLNDETMVKIAIREPLLKPLVRKIQEYRSLGVFFGTFASAPTDSDGRMRCSYNIGGTVTFRLSSSKNAFGSGMNMQNIPSGGDTGEEGELDSLELPNVRRLFIPDQGRGMGDLDLSKADLRIVVWEADEREMKAMLREGKDPYLELAREFYHRPNIVKGVGHYYQTFKSFAHGTHYLGTGKGLANRLGLTVHEAEKTQAWYFGKFPRIKRWQDDLREQVMKRRWVKNVFGYKLYIFDRIEGTVMNEVAAWIPQSTVALIINKIWQRFDNELPDLVEVLMQVHDSLTFQYMLSDLDKVKVKALEHSQIVLPYDDPLIIPTGVKYSDKSWGDCA